mgnify:CR=1 FL=1
MRLNVILLNEVVYGKFEGFFASQNWVALDECVIESFHPIFFDLKSKLLPVHFDVVEVKTFPREVFLPHLLVARLVFFEGFSNRNDIGFDVALWLAELRSWFFYRQRGWSTCGVGCCICCGRWRGGVGFCFSERLFGCRKDIDALS